MKKIVQRTCNGCNAKKDKKKLIRIVINKENIISIDKTGKLPGRGAYICNNVQCLEKAMKTKRLEKTLKSKIDENIYNNIRGVMIDGNEEQEQK